MGRGSERLGFVSRVVDVALIGTAVHGAWINWVKRPVVGDTRGQVGVRNEGATKSDQVGPASFYHAICPFGGVLAGTDNLAAEGLTNSFPERPRQLGC